MSDFVFVWVFFQPGIKPGQTGMWYLWRVKRYVVCDIAWYNMYFYVENPVFDDVSFDFRGSSISLGETLMSDLTQDCVM